jgi:hypothetical protein
LRESSKKSGTVSNLRNPCVTKDGYHGPTLSIVSGYYGIECPDQLGQFCAYLNRFSRRELSIQILSIAICVCLGRFRYGSLQIECNAGRLIVADTTPFVPLKI